MEAPTSRRRDNMRPARASPSAASRPTISPRFNTDLAFWGDRAYQGQFNGFRILDVDNPRRPPEILNYEQCGGATAARATCRLGQHPRARVGREHGQPTRPVTASPSRSASRAARVRHQRRDEPGAGRERQPRVRLAHRHRRARPGQPQAAGVWHAHRARLASGSTSSRCRSAGRRSPSSCASSPRADRPAAGEPTGSTATTPASSSAAPTRWRVPAGSGFTVWSLGGADGGSRDNPRLLYNRAVPEIRYDEPAQRR